MICFRLAIVALLVLAASTAQAEEWRIVGVTGHGGLETAAGEELVLAHIRLPEGLRDGWQALHEEARRELQGQVRAKTVRGTVLGQDRWQRPMVVLQSDSVSLQEMLLGQGLAVVDVRPSLEMNLAPLFAAEEQARTRRAGLWARGYRVFSTTEPMPEGVFAIVEGRVVEATRVRSRIYVNFGSDYRTDFTALIEGALIRRFEAAGLGAEALTGRLVRVRGMLEEWNGPLLRLRSTGDMEVLERAEDGPPGTGEARDP